MPESLVWVAAYLTLGVLYAGVVTYAVRKYGEIEELSAYERVFVFTMFTLLWPILFFLDLLWAGERWMRK